MVVASKVQEEGHVAVILSEYHPVFNSITSSSILASGIVTEPCSERVCVPQSVFNATQECISTVSNGAVHNS